MAEPLDIYKALADETRLRLVRLLLRGALNVNELTDILQMGQSRISRHLKILAEASLVTSRREGTWIYYQGHQDATQGQVTDILGYLRQYEQRVPYFEQDLQGLEGMVARRKEQTRTFFNSLNDPKKMPQHRSSDGQFYRQVAVSLLPKECAMALDMGTGSGLLLPALIGRASQVIAVDSSTTMLDLARQRVGDQGLRCDFRLGDLEHLPVADGEVDVVVACMVLHHLSRPDEAVREAYRVLQPGGLLIIVDLRRHGDETLRERLADLWLGFEPSQVEGWLQQEHFEIIGAEVIGEPDSFKLITFQGQKPWRNQPAKRRAKRTILK
jgi:ArsR family transcriptional regulator